ncbi:GH36 C-terminal domain-containing protein [Streptomyces sp. NPDC047043]|uniref:GH36 C-terminal domain-containing protein n=1 Tax=Streptomyces sp. NPDC047043 TaxID=3154497 RepID=UPI0033EC3E30
MAGVLGGGDLNRWDEGELARAAEQGAACKRVRQLVQRGEHYRLRPVGDGELSAVQYLAPDGRETAVIVLLRARRFGHHDRPLPLRSLDPAARYRDALTGAVLLSQGLPLHLDAATTPPRSSIWCVSRADSGPVTSTAGRGGGCRDLRPPPLPQV